MSLVWSSFRKVVPAGVVGAMFLFAGSPSFAGVFDVVHFLNPGQFSLGLEPQLGLTGTTQLGANLKYTQGINEFMNFAGVLGTSSGNQKFRVGGQLTFDFFPDIEGQPGLGITTSALYRRFVDNGQMDVTVIPYIHKTFHTGGSDEIEPFMAFPFGVALSNGRYEPISSVSFGSLFKNSDHLRYVVEVGVALNHTQSYISGGVVYYP